MGESSSEELSSESSTAETSQYVLEAYVRISPTKFTWLHTYGKAKGGLGRLTRSS